MSEVYCRNSGPEMGGNHFANPAEMPPPESPVPQGLNWDLWVGPAAMRPFYADYLPKKWRAFYDFGSGMLGDWGCHTFDTPVWALDLDPPTAVECLERKPSLDGVITAGSRIKYEFPAKGSRGPVTLYWFDGPQDWSKVGQINKFGMDKRHAQGTRLLDGWHQRRTRLWHSRRPAAHRARDLV